MSEERATTVINLDRHDFADSERLLLRHGALSAMLYRYPTGVEAMRIANARGHVVVLPYLGQIVWRAMFDGVELAMQSMFDAPRPAQTIIETYGALLYHAGILRNGVPAAADTHALHGEMPCMPMDRAWLECGTDAHGAWLAINSLRDYAMGFGAHYRATPRVILRENATEFDVAMDVENLSTAAMDLMYLCHANFAFSQGARIVQPVPFDAEHVITRTAVPSHVTPTDDYRALLAELAADPARMAVLDEPARYNPEQVFYIKGLTPDSDGLVHFVMIRPEGDGLTIGYDPVALPHTVRWVMVTADQQVAAFAMPATCEPEGYTAEKRKGNVRSLPGGTRVVFTTRLGYIDATDAPAFAAAIEARATAS